MTGALRRVGLALTGVAVLTGCNDGKHEDPVVRPVLWVAVQPTSVRILGFTGTVEPRYKVDLGFRLPGRLTSRTVEVGDQLKAGAQVATIDSVPLELAVRSATADVATARAQFTNASAVEGRQRILAERDVATPAQLEGAEQGRSTAAASLRRAEAMLAKASEQLGYAQLRTDAAGVVTTVSAQVGQVVTPGQAVVTIARPEIREASVDVPEEVARAIEPGAVFEVSLQLDPSIRIPGRVREIAPQADRATRTRKVLISLPDPPEVFRLGTTVTASLATKAEPGIALPASAILERDGKTYAWIVDSAASTVSTTEVKVVSRTGAMVRIAEGLPAEARVVTAGVQSLRPGQRVKVPVGDTR